jgi:hypothetical protein
MVLQRDLTAERCECNPLSRRTNDIINLKLLKEIDVKVGNPSNIITGCTISDNGKVLFSEYNKSIYIDRVTLNDSNGNYIRTVQPLDPDSSPATNTKPWLSTTTPRGERKSEVSSNLQIGLPFISQQLMVSVLDV